MFSLKNFSRIVAASTAILLAGCSNSGNPLTTLNSNGTLKISLKIKKSSAAANGMAVSAANATITSAQVVIKKIEFESTAGDSEDYEMKQPFVQNLLTMDSVQVIEKVAIPFGTYEESEIKIDALSPENGVVFEQNPELRGKSVLVKGYLNNDPGQTFVFSSTLDAEQEMEFATPLVIDENTPSNNVVLMIDINRWFVDNNGNPIDPSLPANRSAIEENIKNSFDIFKDKDDDGKDDDHPSGN